MQGAELKHGRIAMLAVTAFAFQVSAFGLLCRSTRTTEFRRGGANDKDLLYFFLAHVRGCVHLQEAALRIPIIDQRWPF
jgi:hypothetical protein